jgi:hypothetical protein
LPSIDFADYIFDKQKQAESITLTEAQRAAIKQIEEYWINRNRNMRNWKTQRHFVSKPESISTRVDASLYRRFSKQDRSTIIRNFTRKFLRDAGFRREFMGRLTDKEMLPEGIRGNCSDLTEFLDFLINAFPYTISGWIPNVEKELLTFYFTFCTDWSLNWALRCALVINASVSEQSPITREEVPNLLMILASEAMDFDLDTADQVKK